MDQLFDSLNVGKRSKPQAKPLKWAVTTTSNHKDFWNTAIKILDSFTFFSLEKQKVVSVPSIKNLKYTVTAFQYLCNVLFEKGFKYVLTRAFNQDPLENFFSYIRSHGVRNINPDVSHFITSFKSLVLNNFMATHSTGSNCQKDMDTECLDNLRSFLTGELIPGVRPLETDEDFTSKISDISKDIPLQNRTKIARCTIVYMSGYIAKTILKSPFIKKCDHCKKNLSIRHYNSMDDDFIESRQYENATLFRPGQYLNFLVTHSLNSLFFLIPRICTIENISKILQSILKSKLNFDIINCPQHKLGHQLCTLIVRCALFWWTRQVNKIVSGTDSKFSRYVSSNPLHVDPIKLQALKIYETSLKRYKK